MMQEYRRDLREAAIANKEAERIMKENDRQMRERMEETDRQLKEQMKETDKQMKETDRQMKETAKRMRETDKLIGNLGNRFGELAEHLVLPGIIEKFNELNFTFERTYKDLVIKNAEKKCLAEIDIMLENGDTIMAVEIKSKPDKSDVDQHIERIEVLRQRADARNDKRKFQGAVAGAVMTDEVLKYIHKAGFYAIEQTGDTMRINIPPDFKPREW
jgi:hypothetical protein